MAFEFSVVSEHVPTEWSRESSPPSNLSSQVQAIRLIFIGLEVCDGLALTIWRRVVVTGRERGMGGGVVLFARPPLSTQRRGSGSWPSITPPYLTLPRLQLQPHFPTPPLAAPPPCEARLDAHSMPHFLHPANHGGVMQTLPRTRTPRCLITYHICTRP